MSLTRSIRIAALLAAGVLAQQVRVPGPGGKAAGGGGGSVGTPTNTNLAHAFSSPVTVQFPNAGGGGSTLVAELYLEGASTATLGCSDGTNGAYTSAVNDYDGTNTMTRMAIFYFKNSASFGAASNTVTCTSTATIAFNMRVLEIPGASTSAPLDQTTAANGFAGNPITATITATASGSVTIGFAALGTTPSEGSGWSTLNGVYGDQIDEYKIANGITTVPFTNPVPGSGGWHIVAASFKP